MNTFLMNMEMAVMPVIAAMEEAGYPVDVGHFKDLKERVSGELVKVTAEIRAVPEAGAEFNSNSPDQVRELLFKRLHFEPLKLTPKGQPSTDGATLSYYNKAHPVVPLLLRFRTLKKVYSTYCDIPEDVGDDGRLHVDFNQLGTETGRLSSQSIVQLLPKADEFKIRDGFCASPGNLLVGVDFKQHELCILAMVSGDADLTTAIESGVDLHGMAAVKVFNLDCAPGEVEQQYPEKRDQIKSIQFGLIYGKSAYTLSADLGCTRDEAQGLIDDYFMQFPAVKQLINDVHTKVSRDGYIDDVFGRRRYFPDARKTRPRKSWDQMTENEQRRFREIGAALRAAQNFVIQAPAATITKLAMVKCHQHLTSHYPGAKLILQLHDELQFEVPEQQVGQFAAELPGVMCNLDLGGFGFTVPFRVDVKVGRTWGGMSKWKGGRDGDQSTD